MGSLEISIATSNFSITRAGQTGLTPVDSGNATDGQWHMFTTVVTANGSIQMFFDGDNNVNITGPALPRFFLGTQHATFGGSAQDYREINDTTFDEVGIWNRTLTAAEITSLYNGGIGLGFQSTSVTLNSPGNDSNLLAREHIFNATVDLNPVLNITNATLFIWNSTNLVNFTTNFTTETADLTTNSYELSANLEVLDDYTWNFLICSNQTGVDPCDFAPDNRTFTINNFQENSQTFNSTTIETAQEDYILNISTNGSSPVSALLIYNGTSISSTQSGTDAEPIFTATQNLLVDDIGNKSFFWNITVGSITTTISTQLQNVSPLFFELCNATFTVPYLNLTFRNETLLQESVNATISSTFVNWLGDGSQNQTLSFINATETPSYEFCGSPPNRPINVDFSVAYNNDISQQRINADTLTLTNITTNRTLYLLPSSLGIFTTFRTEDTVANILSGVLGVITRTLGGVEITVASDTTDSSGIAVFFLNPDVTYTGTFTLTGFVTNIFNFVPISDIRTVIMGGVGVTISNGTDISLNTTYQTFPINSSLTNNTAFTFGLNVTSQQPITLISMNITNQTGHQVGFQSSTSAGFISEIINTVNNSRMQGRFIIQTTNETIEFVRVWSVGLDFAGDYSLFNQGNLFLDYGFREFSRLIIVLLIIIGMMAFLTTTQITDTSESQIGAILTLIWIFSFIGWLDNPIVVAETGLAQFSKQFGIAILTTAGGVFFIMRRLFIRRI